MPYNSDNRQTSLFSMWLPWLLVAGAGFYFYRTHQQPERPAAQHSVSGPFAATPIQWDSTATSDPYRRETFKPQVDTRQRFSSSRTIAPRHPLGHEETTNIEIFHRHSQSVVFIKTAGKVFNSFTTGFDRVRTGSGSGFVWDREGHIVTNFHVVLSSRGSHPKLADRVQVFMADQSSWPAKVVGVAPNKDLAILKIDAPPESLHPLPLGTSHDLQVGQRVLAIGSPFGLDQTLTTGIISGLEREIQSVTKRKIDGVVQTDAAINPGNSGGPLLDSSGRLIGVNTAIYSPSGAYAGIGFAIPVDTVTRFVPELIRYGHIAWPRLGVSLAPASLTRRHGIDGVLVINVAKGGTAADAGLQPTRHEEDKIILGDIIVAMDDTQIRSSEDLLNYLEKHRVGDRASIVVLRDIDSDSPRRVSLPAVLKPQTFGRE